MCGTINQKDCGTGAKMKFGIFENKTALGEFTSDKCVYRKKSIAFRLEKTVKYIYLFSIPLLPLHLRYFSVCENCGEAAPVAGRIARGLAREHFWGAQFKQRFFMALRLILAVAVIAAAAILPFSIRIPVSRDTEKLKSLVSADGNYAVQNADGEVLALINVAGGINTLLWYDKVSVLENTGSEGGTFYLHEYYKEAADSAGNTILIRDIDDPGQLTDQYNSIVRLYYYDEENDALGFYQGVEDFSAIQYAPDKVIYPQIRFDDEGEKQQYVTVLYIQDDAQVRAQFMAAAGGDFTRLVAVSIDTISSGRVTDQQYYYLSGDTIALAEQTGLTQESDARAYFDFIADNALEATITCHYEHFGNTSVVASETQTIPDANGDMQTQTTEYDITAVDGYYVFPYSG